MDININGLKVINNLDNFSKQDFEKLNKGDQLLILNKHNDNVSYEYPYNNITNLFLTHIYQGCIYEFEGTHLTNDIYYEQPEEDDDTEKIEEIESIDCRTKDVLKSFLILKDKKVEIQKVFMGAAEYENDDKILTHFLDMPSYNFIQYDKNEKINEDGNIIITFYLKVPITCRGEKSYICAAVQNYINSSKYSWSVNNLIYIISGDQKRYAPINTENNRFMYNEIIEILNSIYKTSVTDEYDMNKFYNAYKCSNYDIKDFLSNPEFILNVYDTFKYTHLSYDIINKFFDTIFKDDSIDFVANFESKDGRTYNDIKYTFDNVLDLKNEDNKKKVDLCIRKADNICDFLRKSYNNFINVFTGELLQENSKIIYEDAGGLIIDFNNHTSKHITKIDGLYLNAYDKEKDEMYDRINVLNALK